MAAKNQTQEPAAGDSAEQGQDDALRPFMFPEHQTTIMAADREAAEAELAKQLKAQKQSDKEDKK